MSKIVAIEVTPHAIRAAEIANYKKAGRQQLVQTAEIRLDLGIAGETTAKDTEALTEALEKLWEENKFGTKKIGLIASGRGFSVNPIRSRNTDPKHVLSVLPQENPQAMPQDPAAFIADFLPTEQREIKGEEVLNGLVIWAPKQPISEIAFAAKRAKLALEYVDYAPLAVHRWVQENAAAEGETYLLLNIRDESTDFMIVKEGVPQLIRILSKGLDSMERKLERAAALEATRAARARGLGTEAEHLAREIGLTIQSQEEQVLTSTTKIYIAGPRAADMELRGLLESKLAMKTVPLYIEEEDGEGSVTANLDPKFDEFVAMCGGMR